MHAHQIATWAEVSNFIREVFRLQRRHNGASFAGQFRKFRSDDLPEIGRVGVPGAQLQIAADAGLIEKNYFIYYRDMSIVGWHSNAHGNSAGQFGRFLKAVSGTKCQVVPVLQPEAARRLLRGDVQLKQFTVSIPRPRAPEMYPDNDYGKAMLDLLAGGGGDNLHVRIGVDARRGDASAHLAGRVKRAMVELSTLGATTAKAIVYDDGFEHSIDLLADRVTSRQEVDHDGRYPPEQTMFQLIDAARQECEEPLREYFGTADDRIR
jgi:hypothetical protein